MRKNTIATRSFSDFWRISGGFIRFYVRGPGDGAKLQMLTYIYSLCNAAVQSC